MKWPKVEWLKLLDSKDRVALVGVAIVLGSTWMLGRVEFFISTTILGLAVIYAATLGGEER